MANKPFVTLELDKPRRIRFGMNALCELEDLLGVPVDQFDSIPQGMRELRIFLYVGIKCGDKDANVTIDDVGDMIDDSGLTMDEIGEKLKVAMEGAFPQPDKPKTKNKPKN